MNTFKICPRCNTNAPLIAEQCANCGRVYNTKFASTEIKTTPSLPPSGLIQSLSRNRKVAIFFICIGVMGLLFPVFLFVSGMIGDFGPSAHWGTHHPNTAIEMRDMIQREGMGKSNIVDAFGKPDVTQSFTNEYRQTEDVWYYKWSDGNMQITFQYGYVKSINIW